MSAHAHPRRASNAPNAENALGEIAAEPMIGPHDRHRACRSSRIERREEIEHARCRTQFRVGRSAGAVVFAVHRRCKASAQAMPHGMRCGVGFGELLLRVARCGSAARRRRRLTGTAAARLARLFNLAATAASAQRLLRARVVWAAAGKRSADRRLDHRGDDQREREGETSEAGIQHAVFPVRGPRVGVRVLSSSNQKSSISI